MTLHEAQALHVRLIASLIKFVYNQVGNYTLAWGEAYRTAEQAQWDCKAGIGITDSLHCDRLAVDLMLFQDGVYLTDPAKYSFMGTYWKQLDAAAAWGGDFGDSDHFSIAFGGRK